MNNHAHAPFLRLGDDKPHYEDTIPISKIQGSSTRNHRTSRPDPKYKKENHLMHSIWIGLGVGLTSRYLLKNDDQSSLILALAASGSYWYMVKYGMSLPHYEYSASHDSMS